MVSRICSLLYGVPGFWISNASKVARSSGISAGSSGRCPTEMTGLPSQSGANSGAKTCDCCAASAEGHTVANRSNISSAVIPEPGRLPFSRIRVRAPALLHSGFVAAIIYKSLSGFLREE